MPEVRYAKSGDLNIAYHVVGDGPVDLVFVPGFVSHVQIGLTLPSFAAFIEQIGSYARVIRFDKRGTGMSDPVAGAPTLEARMDDLRAVMDATGSRRAAIYGLSEGAAMAILFAATYPQRVAALVLRGAYPRRMWAPDYPWGCTEEQYAREVERDLKIFASRDDAREALRTRAVADPAEEEAYVDMTRLSTTPGLLEALHRMNKEIDVRHVLPAVQAPTLILHGADDTVVPAEVGHYLASRIPSARVVELPGVGHLAYGKAAEAIDDELESFIGEVQEAGGWEEQESDRMLATVLFTDIVGSTARAEELGDRAWRELLEQHHSLIRRQLIRHRGAELDVAGDGFFARFDGPARAVRCACAISDEIVRLGLQVRAGLHTGECELVGEKIGGIAVHIGARVAGQADPGEVLVSSTVKDLVAGSGIRFLDRGETVLKGISGEWRLFAVDRPQDGGGPAG